MLPVLLAVAVLTPAQATPGSDPSCRIVVRELDGANLPAEDRGTLTIVTESLAQEVHQASGCRVVSEDDVRQMLDAEVERQACGEESDSCMAEIGAALGADQLIAGRVAPLGSKYVLQARRIDTHRAEVRARAEQTIDRNPELLPHAARNLARQLFGREPLPLAQTDGRADPTQPEAKGWGALGWTGVGMVALGVVVGAVGGVMAGLAETELSDPDQSDKDASLIRGYAGLGASGLGLVTVAGGAALALAASAAE